jgi:hypothetical protein
MLGPEAAAGELARTVRNFGFHGALVNNATEQSGYEDVSRPLAAPPGQAYPLKALGIPGHHGDENP